MAERELLVHVDSETDPLGNLAREELIFSKVESGRIPEVVRFWTNSECLVRGKARSAKYGWYHEEIAAKLGVSVIERSTGGGVVFHDNGNLNWSFFLRTSGAFLSPKVVFDLASKYVVEALKNLGMPACFSPPNRIDASKRKVSGMAARATLHTLLVHGTLLLRSDLEKLNALCLPPPDCPPVSNVSEWIEDIDAGKVVGAVTNVLQSSGFDLKVVDEII